METSAIFLFFLLILFKFIFLELYSTADIYCFCLIIVLFYLQALNCEWSSQTRGVVLQGEVGSGKTAVIEQLIDYSCFGTKTYGSTLPNGGG